MSLEPLLEGSPPKKMDLYDWRQVAWDIFLVVSVASITALLDVVIPSITTNHPALVVILPVVTAALSAVRRYLMDSRHYQLRKLEELENSNDSGKP